MLPDCIIHHASVHTGHARTAHHCQHQQQGWRWRWRRARGPHPPRRQPATFPDGIRRVSKAVGGTRHYCPLLDPRHYRQALPAAGRTRTHACSVRSSSAPHREPRAPASPFLSSPASPCSRPPLPPTHSPRLPSSPPSMWRRHLRTIQKPHLDALALRLNICSLPYLYL